jgi:hypothetical protein
MLFNKTARSIYKNPGGGFINASGSGLGLDG